MTTQHVGRVALRADAPFIRHAHACDPLVIGLATIVTDAAVRHLLGRSDPAWVRTQRQHSPYHPTPPAPEAQMSVERTHVGHQTRYELRDEAGLSCVLTYTADPDEPATWKILLPGPGGTEDLYGTHRFPRPDAAQLEAWLTPFIGRDHAAELAGAVDAAPPPPAAWRPRSEAD